MCPIGIAGIASKWPAAIAVAVAAQLLQQISAEPAAREPCSSSAEQDASGLRRRLRRDARTGGSSSAA